MKRFNLKKIILIIVNVFFICLLVYSVFEIVKWKIDAGKTDNQIKQLQNKTIINENNDNNNTLVIKQSEDVPKSNPYWDYLKMNMIDVDFSELKKINSDVKGWIQVNGTNINYPFVQSTNNSYYLNHSYDKSYNNAGWLFMDYRNNDFTNKNTIIYAHARIDKTMFGTLKNVLKDEWFNNTDNYVIKISSLNENSLWQIFSVYYIPSTNDYLLTEFKDDNHYQNFLDMIKNRSFYDFNTSVNTNNTILTLSTCYKSTNKLVVHAKLIKTESK